MVLNSKQAGFPPRSARMFVLDKENICKTCFASFEHTRWRYRMDSKIRRRVWNTEIRINHKWSCSEMSKDTSSYEKATFIPPRSSIWTICAPNSITKAVFGIKLQTTPPTCNTWPKVCSPVSCASWPTRLLAEQMSNQSSSSSSQVVPGRRRGGFLPPVLFNASFSPRARVSPHDPQ